MKPEIGMKRLGDQPSRAAWRTARRRRNWSSLPTGDRLSLNELLARYYPRLERFVSRRIRAPMGRLFDVADVTQQAFLHASGCFGRFEMRNERSPMNWLGRIAEHTINELRDYLDAGKRAQQTAGSLELPDHQPAVVDRLAQEEKLAAVHRALAKLPAIQREILRLRYGDGWTGSRSPAQWASRAPAPHERPTAALSNACT